MTIRHTTTNLPHYHSTHYVQRPVPKGHNFMHIKHTFTYTHTRHDTDKSPQTLRRGTIHLRKPPTPDTTQTNRPKTLRRGTTHLSYVPKGTITMTIRHTTTNLPHYHSTHYVQRPVPKGHNFMHIKHTVTYTHTRHDANKSPQNPASWHNTPLTCAQRYNNNDH